jgi:hypothetical protein
MIQNKQKEKHVHIEIHYNEYYSMYVVITTFKFVGSHKKVLYLTDTNNHQSHFCMKANINTKITTPSLCCSLKMRQLA